MLRVEPGRRIKVIGGLLDGLEATILHVHPQRGSVTAAIEAKDIHLQHRHKYHVNRKGYVPVEVLEEEFEIIEQRIISFPKRMR